MPRGSQLVKNPKGWLAFYKSRILVKRTRITPVAQKIPRTEEIINFDIMFNTKGALAELSNNLSPESQILLDKSAPEFNKSLKRWPDYQVHAPLAIMQPASEQDILISVQELLKTSISFVPATGGNTPYSTIEDGVILDSELIQRSRGPCS